MQEAQKRKNLDDSNSKSPLKRSKKRPEREEEAEECKFVGKPVPADEARRKWPDRYLSKKKMVKKETSTDGFTSETVEVEVLQAKCHYKKAMVDGVVFNLYDDAYVKAEEGQPDYIAKIVEFFETSDNKLYFTAQWFYRARDTVIKDHGDLVDKGRVFFSDIRDDNPLDCIVAKVKISQIASTVDADEREKRIQSCDLYCEMKYTLPYLTFANLVRDNHGGDTDSSSTISSESGSTSAAADVNSGIREPCQIGELPNSQMTLLDLYSGCGAMSTGLCLGASLSGLNLVTRWAVDINPHACQSLKKNHPETQVRNEAAENFLSLLKEWEKLCREFAVCAEESQDRNSELNIAESDEEEQVEEEPSLSSEEFEVGKLLAVCYGDPNNVKKPGLYFKVRWKGYGPSEDTWEPIEGLSNCKESIEEFVVKAYRSKLLPLPGDVDVICGGPPCQGVSGFNRFRDKEDPLKDPKNHQLVVYMDIVNYLKPKYVLMENVVDILKFASGFLGRYAVGRLVGMGYQARLGIMAAGSYGLPQFRLRVFLWGALPTEKLPQLPLPTHDVVTRGGVPCEFEDIYVSYGKNQSYNLEKALLLGDAISDLPLVTNDEDQDERPYGGAARTEFQKYMRLKIEAVASGNGSSQAGSHRPTLYDHRPLKLNADDFERVCQIPKKKGANFRDLPGVVVGAKNIVEWDPSIERVLLPSGKPLVPDYAMKFVRGTSTKPFGRLWWDEIVSTVVTRAEPHNQVIMHPLQDRVLTIRENARLQGFPDCYRLYGPIKERYIQVGNAVAVPVAMALGFTLGKAVQGLVSDKPLTTLTMKFPSSLACLKQN
ncbi:Alpha-1,3-mannosyltransferase cmt1 [Ancistrocladus abbreviatus]